MGSVSLRLTENSPKDTHNHSSKQQKVVINDIPKPTPAPYQFLVKIHSASLCHSDLGMSLRPDYPVTLGHEGVGHIESFGSEASDHGFAIGDAIGFNYFTGCCYTCSGCQVHNLRCETGNQKLQGFVADGFFAEYAVVDWMSAVKIPESLDMKRAAPLFCAGITAFHSVDGCELEAGMWLAVVGCGGLGQYAIQYAKAVCSSFVNFVDILLFHYLQRRMMQNVDLTGIDGHQNHCSRHKRRSTFNGEEPRRRCDFQFQDEFKLHQ